MSLLIKNALILGSKNPVDIAVEDGFIKKIAENITGSYEKVINADKKLVLPAFVDIHTHLREPGFEGKETIETGAAAAVAGGYSAVCCMPNTKPVLDNPYIIEYVKNKAQQVGLAKVFPIGAITKGELGKELADIGKMKQAGAVAISDDGVPVSDSNIMRLAMEYAAGFDMPVISHCEDLALADGGVMNEGEVATRLGLRGISRASEEVAVAREILIASATNTKIHIAHISTEGSVRLVRDAKAAGINVTAETCPHYIAGTDELCDGFNASAKVNPPLRTEKDRQAIINGICDGTIDVIATDHAPHTLADKSCGFDLAANGISGLETAYALCFTYLVKTGLITAERLSQLMTKTPATLMGLSCGEVKEGGLCDLVIVDNDKKYKIDSKTFKSKGKNTPFDGFEVFGKIKYTIVEGEVKYADN